MQCHSNACNKWQLTSLRKVKNIHDIAQQLGKANPRVFTLEKATSGFEVAGIYPVDRSVFPYDEFPSFYITDREMPGTSAEEHSEQKTDDIADQSDNGNTSENDTEIAGEDPDPN